ncbi:hypothetical protein LMG27952_07497 [Paraburkholderia hiiakae]|uniref:Uncharacterized protein n=1 Tax=Paraburkholderia hiiakae TaxID=1081782 RepID=A0ABM8PB68_9BURK|nr:hypothetical protein LMG27952_07497 [Paraburkholderia hiiakae]
MTGRREAFSLPEQARAIGAAGIHEFLLAPGTGSGPVVHPRQCTVTETGILPALIVASDVSAPPVPMLYSDTVLLARFAT